MDEKVNAVREALACLNRVLSEIASAGIEADIGFRRRKPNYAPAAARPFRSTTGSQPLSASKNSVAALGPSQSRRDRLRLGDTRGAL